MNMNNILQVYADVEEHVSLRKRTTFRIGGICRYFIYPKNEMCLLRVLDILEEAQVPHKIFGKGSNILCSDEPYDGAIICLDRYFTDFYFEENGSCMVQAGTSIILLAHEAMKASLRGLEFASGIPGTIGGALFMNAGAYKSDISNVLIDAYVLKGREIVVMSRDELEYKYRHSLFQKHPDWIILGCRMQLEPGDQKEIRDLMDSRRKRRMDAQPLRMPCAGSMFRNPAEHQAWELIEKVGMRGERIGDAMVSDKHANFIVNAGEASASDVMTLITEIQKAVKQQFQVELITEVEKFNWKN